MALSREQFQELRNKGLSVEQIVAFERGEVPSRQSKPQFREDRPFRDTLTGLGKSLGKIGIGIGTFGRGIQRAITPKQYEDRAMGTNSPFDMNSDARKKVDEFLAPDSKAERTAMFVGDVASYAIPASRVYKATTGLGTALRLLGRGSFGAAGGTIQGGGDIDKDTAIGAGVEIAAPAVGKVFSYGGNVLKGLAGLVSGKGSDVIDQVLKTPHAALEGGQIPGAAGLKESAQMIRSGVKTIRQKAGQEFEELTKNHTKPLNKKAFKSLINDFFEDIDQSTFIGPDKIGKLRSVVDVWNDYSPMGLNKLASKISKFYSGSVNSTDTDAVVSSLNRRIRDWVGEQIPDIAEANTRYTDKMDLLDQMRAIFNTKGAVDSRLGLQKTAEAVGRLFNASRDIAREGVEEIERELGFSVLGREAGRQLVDGVSRSQSAIGDFATGVSRAILPSKLLLQVTARTGIAKDALEKRINTLAPTAKAIVIEFLTDLFGEGERTNQ